MADFLIQAGVPQMNKNLSLWKRASIDGSERHRLHRSSVLPIRPVLELNKFCTNRIIVYELVNADIIEKFV